MSKVSLIDAFEIKPSRVKVENISDYEIFKDKELLDNLNLLRGVTSFDREAYNTWVNSWNMTEDIILLVSSYAKDKGQPIQYMNKILSSLYDDKIFTLDEAKIKLESFGKTSTKSKKAVANFEEREYNQKDLDALFDNLDNIEI